MGILLSHECASVLMIFVQKYQNYDPVRVVCFLAGDPSTVRFAWKRRHTLIHFFIHMQYLNCCLVYLDVDLFVLVYCIY